MKIYLDNAATTFPKPPEVYTSMMNYMMNIGTNPGRGASTATLSGNKVILNCRYALMDFFHFDFPKFKNKKPRRPGRSGSFNRKGPLQALGKYQSACVKKF